MIGGNGAGGRLGRGLAALLPEGTVPVDAGGGVYRRVPIDEIVANPEQPRAVFDAGALEELTASLRQHGILTPLVVRRSEGRYVLIAGERRLRAAGLAGLHEVPVVVREAEAPREQLELALIENLQREDLDAVEAARGYDRLVRVYGLTQEEVARRVGKDRATVANALRMLRLPDWVLVAVQAGKLSAGHARTVVPLADREAALRPVVARVVAEGLSVRATEALVRKALAAATVREAPSDDAQRKGSFAYIASSMTTALQASVQVQGRRDGSGAIVIRYGSADELDRLFDRLVRGRA
jgi:ParB family chromosome partitioning protein